MFGANLKKLREDSHLSQEQLADAIGVSKSTIGMYEQGKRMPNTNTILKDIASYFGVSIDYLVGFHQEGAGVTDEDFSRFGLRPIHRRRIPMLGKIACGEPIMCEEEYETFADSGADIDADFCVIAQGDSMINARIFDGDVVFVKQEPVENGQIAVVRIGEEYTLKRIYRFPDYMELRAENPMYPAQIIRGEQENAEIVGRAVQFLSRVI